jgi:hypothetical protein
MNDVSLKLALALGITLLTVACASEPQAAADAGADAAAAGTTTLAANDENKLECRNERVTGSNLPRKVCRTVATWAALQRAERRMSDEYTRQASQAAGRVDERNGGPVSPTAVGILPPGGV